MAERIVDDLELVEIDVQQRMRGIDIVTRSIQRTADAVFEFAAIDQSRQRIVRRLVAQLPEQSCLLAHVMEYHD